MKNSFATFLKLKSPKLGIVVLFGVLTIVAARFCHHETRGFKISKITDNLPLVQHQGDEEPSRAATILAQKFHFLNRGLQSFSFLSEDGNYVLKVFNNKNKRLNKFYSFFLKIPPFSFWALAHSYRVQEKEELTFESYHIANKEMREKTALVYLHTEKTNHLPSSITLIDPLHISHEIDPNKLGFLIQQKVSMAYPTLERWIEKKELDKARAAISSLLQLFFFKWKQGLNDSDPLIRTNYGFIGTEAIQIDVGPLSHPPALPSFQEFSCELRRITTSLRIFLSQRSPELLTYLDRELEELLSSER